MSFEEKHHKRDLRRYAVDGQTSERLWGFAVFFGPCTLRRTWGARPISESALDGSKIPSIPFYEDLDANTARQASGGLDVGFASWRRWSSLRRWEEPGR